MIVMFNLSHFGKRNKYSNQRRPLELCYRDAIVPAQCYHGNLVLKLLDLTAG